MRKRTPTARRKHQLVLSLSPHCLHILHVQRGLMGWKRSNTTQLALSEGDDFLEQIQTHISECIARWKLPPAAQAYWVLAGDILGVIPAQQGDASAAAALPFSSNDTRTQPDQYTNADPPSVMWMHKDWVAEIERISAQSQLTLVEIFARAQLFQRQVALSPGQLKLVIEQESGENFLHIFSSDGMMLRTRVLGDFEISALHSLLRAEIASLDFSLDEAHSHTVHLLAPAGLVGKTSDWNGFDCHALRDISHAKRLEQLWRSDLAGIVIRPTYEAVINDIKVLSVTVGAAGLVGLGLMVWHDGKLRDQIEEHKSQAQRDVPAVGTAKALKKRTLQLADAVAVAETVRGATAATVAFTHILANFPPAPATLLYVRTDQKSLAFAGQGDEASVKWIQEKSFPGYEPLVELPVPEFLQNSNPSIRFQTRKSTPSDAVPPGKTLPASTPGSRTTTP